MKKLITILFVTLLVGALIFTGCAKQAPAPATAPTPTPAPTPVPTPAPKPATSFTKLTFVTTSAGTGPHSIAVAWSTLARKYTPNLEISIVPAVGAPQAVNYFFEGSGDIVYNPSSVSHATFSKFLAGKHLSEGPLAILASAGSAVHIITPANSDIKSVADFKGKKVLAKIPAAPSNDDIRQKILAEYGMTDDDIILLSGNNGSHLAQQLREGVGDAAVITQDVPNAAIVELCTMKDIRWISLPKEKSGFAESLWVKAGKISAGTYPKQKEDVSTVTLPSAFSVRNDMNEEVAYALVKLFHEHFEELSQMAPWAKNFTVKYTIEAAFIPFHPGAVKYYKEQGVWTGEVEAEQQALRNKKL